MSASFSAPRLRPRQLSAGDLVEESLLDPANGYLRIVRARQPGMDLRQWIAAAGAGLRDSLLRHGGILFRGFAVDGAEGFSQAVQGFSPNMLDYLERAAARQEVAHRVFTSTEFSPDGWIPPHHEMSYSHNWPSYIHFYCQTPPATQGRTPLADERRVSARIPEAIRQRFLRHGVCYVRNYGPEIDLTWQEGFQTDSRAEVEAYCRQTGTQWTWLDDQRLNTRQVRQAMVRHPLSGERCGSTTRTCSMSPTCRRPWPGPCSTRSANRACRATPTTATAARSRRRCWTPSAPPTARKPARSPGSAAMS